MNRLIGSRPLLFLAAWGALLLAIQPSLVDAQTKDVRSQNAPAQRLQSATKTTRDRESKAEGVHQRLDGRPCRRPLGGCADPLCHRDGPRGR